MKIFKKLLNVICLKTDPNTRDSGLRTDKDRAKENANFKIMTIMKAIGDLEYLICLVDIFTITNSYMRDKFTKNYQMEKVFF